MTRRTTISAALVLAACSNTTTTTTTSSGGPPFEDAGAASNPCGPNGFDGTFSIKGTLSGTENLCGLALGSFDAGTLTIAEAAGSGATVTVTQSGAGHIDVASCAATVSGCSVKTATCSGSKDVTASVTLDLDVTGGALSGTSQLRYGGCQAPGLSFTGTR
jgi:hypothetical protein